MEEVETSQGQKNILPNPDSEDLLNFPRSDLDRLYEVESAARRGEAQLAEWRVAHRQLFGDQLSREVVREAEELSKLAVDVAFGFDNSAPPSEWSTMEKSDRRAQALLMARQARSIQPPPSNTELLKLLHEADREIRQNRTAHLVSALQAERETVLRWMREVDEIPRDESSGIPLESIKAAATTDHPVLGAVPQTRRSAMAAVWLAATEEERAVFDRFAGDPTLRVNDWKLAQATGQLQVAAIVDFLVYLTSSASKSAQTVVREWHEGDLRNELASFLED